MLSSLAPIPGASLRHEPAVCRAPCVEANAPVVCSQRKLILKKYLLDARHQALQVPYLHSTTYLS